MYTEFEIRELPLSLVSIRDKVTNFLSESGLRLEDVDRYFGIFHIDDDEILAAGGFKENLIKCIAVNQNHRDQQFANRLISHLINTIISNGYNNVKVFTKPSNTNIFNSLGFVTIATSKEAVLMENSPNGISKYKTYLSQYKQDGINGAIVMNANPFTKGHRYLIEKSAEKVDNLYVIAVKEEKSQFSYWERFNMIKDGCKGLNNVTICEGSEYIISSSTFPTYFIKELSHASVAQIELDLNIFVKHIAPALNISKRFVGSEPIDSLTREYNSQMKRILPTNNIEVEEIERMCVREESNIGVDNVVSASALRKYLNEGSFKKAASLAYPTTIPYLISQLSIRALERELYTTPKPGLVDKNNNGSHRDMNISLMQKSIDTLHPFFTKLSLIGYNKELPDSKDIIEIGVAAEKEMLKATNNVNTHKGALFSIGLAIVSASHLHYNGTHFHFNGKSIEKGEELSQTIAKIAHSMPKGVSTHGESVRNRYNVKGAIDEAQRGYKELFECWLPYYLKNIDDKYVNQKTLSLIMSKLEDSNVYYRGGTEGAELVKKRGKELLEDYSDERAESIDREFIAKNLSPGGCADMLSATIFIGSLIS